MLGANLLVPLAPMGVDQATHLRGVLARTLSDASATIARLDSGVADHLCDEAVQASTFLVELCSIVRDAVEQRCDDELGLGVLLAHVTRAIEQGEHVIAASSLRRALAGDEQLWDEVASRALVIEELARGQFASWAVNDLGCDRAGLARLDDRAGEPVIAALVRAVAGGICHAAQAPLRANQIGRMFDELLHKLLTQHGERVDSADPMRHLRWATSAGTALWNLTRICRRDHMVAAARKRDLTVRRRALRRIRRELGPVVGRLGAEPDLEYAWDVGVGFGSIEPTLLDRAEGHRVQMSLRANPWVWYDLFRSLPND